MLAATLILVFNTSYDISENRKIKIGFCYETQVEFSSPIIVELDSIDINSGNGSNIGCTSLQL